MLKEVQDSSMRYNSLIEVYKQGKRNYATMPNLVQMAKELGDSSIYNMIINDYVSNYLNKLDDIDLFTKQNLQFVFDNSKIASTDKIFKLIYRRPIEADRLVESTNYSQQIIGWVINKEEIIDKLWSNPKSAIPFKKKPDWSSIRSTITNKYNKRYADSLVLPAQVLFYTVLKDWKSYALCVEKAIKRFSPGSSSSKFSAAIGGTAIILKDGDAWGLNDSAWKLFEGTNDRVLLNKGLKWSELSIKIEQPSSDNYVQFLDTKANLLYKLGRIKEAIVNEQKALEIENNKAAKKRQFIEVFKETLKKMKQDIPSWPTTSNVF
jgi:tetratricopeptide (TPR) repeat protein